MRRLRTASTRNILAICAAIAVLAGGAAVAQAALGGASAPPAKPLDRAIYDAARAPAVAGLSARIHFTNNLLPSGSLPEGATSPMISGADGRLWLSGDGKIRLELQSDAGDAQIVSDGSRFMVYDASSNTAYTGALPADKHARKAEPAPTLAGIDKGLANLSRMWTLSRAQPGTTADRPSYTVRIAPKDDGGLLGAAELAWDAARGVPLRAAVYAQGQATPVLELKATHVAYGAIPASTFTAKAPAGAQVTQISDPAPPAGGLHSSSSSDVTGAAAVAKAVDFRLAAPKTLAGLPLKQVRLVKSHDGTGAVSVYGQGLGAILVVQSKGGENPLGKLRLPRIAIGNATGSELGTALGTVLTFQRGGVSYVVAGSVPPLAAENAARGLR
jgi:outer membrane lipoprotein-sorting protein